MIADAPWIREAENWGMPPFEEMPDPVCPFCGKNCGEFYLNRAGEVVGCEECIQLANAYDWMIEHKEE